MKALFVALILLGSSANAETKLSNCSEDVFNPIKNSCQCDTYDEETKLTGFVVLSCSDVACEQFGLGQEPDDCEPGMRGVTCEIQNTYNACSMAFPRVPVQVNARTLCESALGDIAENGHTSEYYPALNHQQCIPAGAAWAPTTGWSLIQVIDGWL